MIGGLIAMMVWFGMIMIATIYGSYKYNIATKFDTFHGYILAPFIVITSYILIRYIECFMK